MLSLWQAFPLWLFFWVSNAPAAYLDPHNHINGVLLATDYANIQKVILEEEINIEELAKLWDALANLYNEDYEKDRRNSRGTLNTLMCNEPKEILLGSNPEESDYRNILVKNIERVLSASPNSSFDSAYAHRGRVRSIILSGLSGEAREQAEQDLRRATIFRLALDQISLVEMSITFIGGDKNQSRVKNMLAYNTLINDLLSAQTSSPNAPLKKVIKEKNLPVPRIFWLLMTHSSEFGQLDDGMSFLDYSDGECLMKPFHRTLSTDPEKDLYDILLKHKNIIGTDSAGVETTCFTDYGMKFLENLVKTVYRASQERRRHEKEARKLLVHVHAGEGAPLVDQYAAKNKKEACQLMDSIRVARRSSTDRPIHLVEAGKNIDRVLGLIKRLKRDIADLDDFLIFRIGHATALTKAQAFLIKELNIEVDVNLSSNLATGSWPLPMHIFEKYINNNPLPTRLLESLLKNKEIGAPDIFHEHGLKWLLYYRVLTILGTDASGVEHASMAREYQMAGELIEYWNITDEDFKSKNISIDTLINNQKIHHDAMGYSVVDF